MIPAKPCSNSSPVSVQLSSRSSLSRVKPGLTSSTIPAKPCLNSSPVSVQLSSSSSLSHVKPGLSSSTIPAKPCSNISLVSVQLSSRSSLSRVKPGLNSFTKPAKPCLNISPVSVQPSSNSPQITNNPSLQSGPYINQGLTNQLSGKLVQRTKTKKGKLKLRPDEIEPAVEAVEEKLPCYQMRGSTNNSVQRSPISFITQFVMSLFTVKTGIKTGRENLENPGKMCI